VNLGNFLEAIQAGAELIFMAGGVGPCRFGYYGQVQREILTDAGYPIEFLVLEAPKTHPEDLWRKIKHYCPRHHPVDLARAVRMAWLKAAALDRLDRLANRIRPLEQRPGTVDALQADFYRQMDEADTVKRIKVVGDQFGVAFNETSVWDDLEPIRILLVGEIYMVLESRLNFEIEKTLGQFGANVERSIYFTDWVRDQLLFSIIYPAWRNTLFGLARPYLGQFVGGHGLETVAHTVTAGINHYDGVVQILPFTCIPEIVAMQVLPTVSRELAIPVLSLIIDEHSGAAGIYTRLEAFCDLLKYHKKRRHRSFGAVSGS
jgi:predicted nucleotide-binding protein (sugar kinase/HSP70/actin superfamily)